MRPELIVLIISTLIFIILIILSFLLFWSFWVSSCSDHSEFPLIPIILSFLLFWSFWVSSYSDHSELPLILIILRISIILNILLFWSFAGDRWLVQCLGCLYSSKGLFYRYLYICLLRFWICVFPFLYLLTGCLFHRVVPADQGFHSADDYAGIFR